MAKVLVNFQDEFLQEVDKIAELEHRTRSSLIREALRRYISGYKVDGTPSDKIEKIENINQSKLVNKIVYPVSKVS